MDILHNFLISCSTLVFYFTQEHLELQYFEGEKAAQLYWHFFFFFLNKTTTKTKRGWQSEVEQNFDLTVYILLPFSLGLELLQHLNTCTRLICFLVLADKCLYIQEFTNLHNLVSALRIPGYSLPLAEPFCRRIHPSLGKGGQD